MIPLVKICNSGKSEIVITDLTQDSNEYVTETVEDATEYYQENKFKYSETYTVNIIQKNNIDKEEIVDCLITDHSSHLDEVYYKIPEDGFYTIHHLILPTKEWLEANLDKIIDRNIYICDGESIFQYKEGELFETTPEELLTIDFSASTISKLSLDQFSIYYLYDCYINICKQIFNSANLRCLEKSNIDPFKRDFLWMTINVIKYYVELNQLLEAQRLLEEINFCGGMCNGENVFEQQTSGCGCGK